MLYQILAEALGAAPRFATMRGRQALVHQALDGYAYSADLARLLLSVDLEGPPRDVASSLVQHLDGNEAAPGVPALALLAQAIEQNSSGAQREKLRQLREHMGWGATYAAPTITSPWRDSRSSDELVREKIIGENTLRHIHYLRRALVAADAVARISVGSYASATGFMVSPDLMMTNNHVIGSEEEARKAKAWFFDEVQAPRVKQAAKTADTKPLVYTNRELDITVVRLQGAPTLERCFPLRPVVMEQNARVAIIQHPNGESKKIAMQNNLVAAADARSVQYYASTEAGSSGSPVLDDDFAVVAVHWGWDRGEGGADRNQGTSVIALLEDLKTAAPDLLKELTVLTD